MAEARRHSSAPNSRAQTNLMPIPMNGTNHPSTERPMHADDANAGRIVSIGWRDYDGHRRRSIIDARRRRRVVVNRRRRSLRAIINDHVGAGARPWNECEAESDKPECD